MESITLEQAYYIGEIIAAVAVIASLVYLAVQLKQNTQAIRLNTGHNASEQLIELYAVFGVGEPERAALALKGMQSPETLEPTEKMAFMGMLHSFFRGYENLYYQHAGGALDARVWKGAFRSMIDMTKQPGMTVYWEARKHWYSDGFQEHLAKEVMAKPAVVGYTFAGT